MEISIRQRGVQVDDVLREDIERRIGFALRAFEPRINRVEFLIEERNLRRSDSEKSDSERANDKSAGRPVKSDKKGNTVRSVRMEGDPLPVDESDPLVERVDTERKSVRAERLRGGADKYCQVLIYPRRGALMKVEDSDVSVTALVGRVADRIGYVVSRRFERGVANRVQRDVVSRIRRELEEKIAEDAVPAESVVSVAK
ncbi:MAG: hypothetical protein Q4C47_04015 [Planctomycetia bacterium]|nr:hypothetical protein [Planctomycetia bacterium]